MVHYPDLYVLDDRLRGVESNVAAIARHLGVLVQPPIGTDPEPAEPGPTAPEVQVAGANLDQAESRQVTGYPDTPRGRQNMPTSPALARATDEVVEVVASVPGHVSQRLAQRIATRAVAAALSSSDQVRDHDEGRDPVAEALCTHDDSAHHMERTDDFPCSACVSTADAVRAAILGEAS